MFLRLERSNKHANFPLSNINIDITPDHNDPSASVDGYSIPFELML